MVARPFVGRFARRVAAACDHEHAMLNMAYFLSLRKKGNVAPAFRVIESGVTS